MTATNLRVLSYSPNSDTTAGLENRSSSTESGFGLYRWQSADPYSSQKRNLANDELEVDEKATSTKIEALSKRLMIRKVTPPTTDFGITLQDWEGFVETLEDDYFIARLRSRSAGENADSNEIAEIPNSEVDADDRDLLKIGAIFYLTVRRRILITGRHEIASQIVFRRLPAWSKGALAKIDSEATALADFFAAGTR